MITFIEQVILKQKIEKQEKGAEIFGYPRTPELRARADDIWGLGMVGTLYKTATHYLQKVVHNAAAETAEVAVEKHEMED